VNRPSKILGASGFREAMTSRMDFSPEGADYAVDTGGRDAAVRRECRKSSASREENRSGGATGLLRPSDWKSALNILTVNSDAAEPKFLPSNESSLSKATPTGGFKFFQVFTTIPVKGAAHSPSFVDSLTQRAEIQEPQEFPL